MTTRGKKPTVKRPTELFKSLVSIEKRQNENLTHYMKNQLLSTGFVEIERVSGSRGRPREQLVLTDEGREFMVSFSNLVAGAKLHHALQSAYAEFEKTRQDIEQMQFSEIVVDIRDDLIPPSASTIVPPVTQTEVHTH